MQVALSIDAGFGVTKFSHRPDRQSSKVAFSSFPSVAMQVQRTPNIHEITRGRRTALVEYKGNTYSIGPDAYHELAGNMFGRNLSGDYYTSDIYHALMRGALSFMDEKAIDVLVLGLPMDRFDYPDLIESLQKEYTGLVDIDSRRSIAIGQVIVHPQPFGGYIGLGRHINGINEAAKNYPHAKLPHLKSAQDILDLNVLIVDSGAYTLDWLFMKPSGYIRNASSAANNAGRHRIVRQLYDKIKSELAEAPPINLLFDIDEAERKKTPIRIKGRAFDLQEEKYQTLIRHAVDDSIRQMEEHIGANIHRVDLIAVVGGEPSHVSHAIQRKLPEIPLFVVPSGGEYPSIYANLSGFQEYAEQMAQTAGQSGPSRT